GFSHKGRSQIYQPAHPAVAAFLYRRQSQVDCLINRNGLFIFTSADHRIYQCCSVGGHRSSPLVVPDCLGSSTKTPPLIVLWQFLVSAVAVLVGLRFFLIVRNVSAGVPSLTVCAVNHRSGARYCRHMGETPHSTPKNYGSRFRDPEFPRFWRISNFAY